MNLKKCQIFTPTKIVKKMLDEIQYIDDIYDKKIIDISCGDGNILCVILQRMIKDSLNNNLTLLEIKENIEKNIFGYDIDQELVEKCKINLDIIAIEYGLVDINWNVSCDDGLECGMNGFFDYVVGNPPYIAYKDLDLEIRDYVKLNFQTCAAGKFDYSYAFIEKGINLLSPVGQMVYITPSNMFKTVFGELLREFIRPNLTKVIDYSDVKVFEKVLTSPAITVYKAENESELLIYHKVNIVEKIETVHEKLINKDDFGDKWDFTGYVRSGDKRFDDDFKVANSIATLSNNLFIKNIEGVDSWNDIDIEDYSLRVAKSPRSMRYHYNQKIVFPYYYNDNNKLTRYTEEEFIAKFPLAYKYLKNNKEKLLLRDSDENAKWYEYGRSQALLHLNCEKLLVSSIVTNNIIVYKLGIDEIPYSGIFISSKNGKSIDTAISILESKDFSEYLLSKGIRVSGESIRISSKDIASYRY